MEQNSSELMFKIKLAQKWENYQDMQNYLSFFVNSEEEIPVDALQLLWIAYK